MKDEHLRNRMNQVLTIAQSSRCPRRQFACLIIDPLNNRVISDGWNGPAKGKDELCGGSFCYRELLSCQSGTSPHIGCHHAELNAICNAASMGVSTKGAFALVNGEPCLMCAKILHHALIDTVVIIRGGYLGASLTEDEGVKYLKKYGVNVVFERLGNDPRKEDENG
jgi:dCMP deaminase